jgi:hypothetical protein
MTIATYKLTHQEFAMTKKHENIIDMALTFTAMMRLFEKDSKPRIAKKLSEIFGNLDTITSQKQYKSTHHEFCLWFARSIQTAEKTFKNGRTKPKQLASYGQAAKVIDISIKVFVYYCEQPNPITAGNLIPFLNGAIDNPILAYLKTKYPNIKITSSTIEQIDEGAYGDLQKLIALDVLKSFNNEVYPVQYDDILWNMLNRYRELESL